MKSVTIIGSGISGLSIARMLADRYNIKIVEKGERIGGLIKCDRIDGNLFHRVGGHVFNSKNQEVLNWFWKHFDRESEFLQAIRNAKILLKGQLIGYPIENYLYQLPETDIRAIVDELLQLVNNNKHVTEYSNFKDFLIGNFGENLYRLYFGPYNSKIWNTDLSVVPLDWLDGKLPMPQIREVIISNILKKEESSMVHAKFYYPKRDGSQFIINRLAEGLDINTSFLVNNIVYDNGRLKYNGSFEADSIVYCGDVRELHKIVKIEDDNLAAALDAVKELPSNGTSNVLCETDDNDLSWLYLPDESFKAHRIIYTGNFSPSNNEGSSRKTCVVEFSGKQEKEEMIKVLEMLPGNLKPLEFNYEPNSYVIQSIDTREKVNLAKSHLAKYNIFLLGRFAEWEYHNMDKCIEGALALNSQL